MSPTLDPSVELLERSLAYTRIALAGIGPGDLGRDTPCSQWTLAALLAHMEDSLEVFTLAAGGEVPGEGEGAADGPGDRITRLQTKACALLGVWSAPQAARQVTVAIGDRGIAAPLLVGTAALEITVHGWDVGQATGRGGPIPAALAAGLLRLAGLVAPPAHRAGRFARPRTLPATSSPSDRLVAYLGRDPFGQASANLGVPAPGLPPAS